MRSLSFTVGFILAQTLLVAQTTASATTTTIPTNTAVSNARSEPDVIEDGGFSLEPFYWLSRAQPSLYGGKTATAYGDFDYLRKSKNGEGIEAAIPTGHANTLRISYFRLQGNANSTIGQDETIFSEAYTAGDYLTSTYRVQSAKISWDYLSYTFKNNIRLKTLYEIQYVTISTDVSAPFVAQVYDSTTETTDTNSSHGSENLFLPTFGAEFEQAFRKHFRWEAKASGFGLPHHADIWDAQADVAFRIRSVEISLGGKAYHYKTSENTAQYFTQTPAGAYAGLRYYFGDNRQ